ncbi:MAG: hypothetical protein P8Y70_14965, partial [Candidatus Lokiarchaeota archaeon]
SAIFTVLVLMVFSYPVLASSSLTCAYESKQDNNLIGMFRDESDVKLGEDVVFSTSGNGGETDYGIWIKGINNYALIYSSVVDVEIYARCYVEIQEQEGGRLITGHLWEPLPLNLIVMSSDFDFNPSSGSYTWTVGASSGDFSFGVASSGNPTCSWSAYSDTSNGWRHIGGFASSAYGHQTFAAFLRLHVYNNLATEYYNGKCVSQTTSTITYWFIKQIQFQLNFHFESNGVTYTTHTHILGDGNIPSGYTGADVNEIYFVPGTSN